jgi:hypothetical protein
MHSDKPVTSQGTVASEKYREVVFLAARLWKALEATKAKAEKGGVQFAPQDGSVRAIKAFHKWNRNGR